MTPSREVIAAAQAAQRRWGVPAAISIGQYALESAWGTHMPAGSNNPFGIKARAREPAVSCRTREVVNGRSIFPLCRFAIFPTIAAAFDAHARLLATAPAYAKARRYTHGGGEQDEAFADALTGIYATAPDYGSALRAVMRGGDLYRYDVAPG